MRFFKLLRSISYIILGFVCILLRMKIVNHLGQIVGITLIVLAGADIIFDILTKRYYSKHHIGTSLISLALGIVFILYNADSQSFIGVIWGAISLFKASRTLNEAITNLSRKKHSLVLFLEGTITSVLSILLIISPIEHLASHVLILGLEFILEAFRILYNEYGKGGKDYENVIRTTN